MTKSLVPVGDGASAFFERLEAAVSEHPVLEHPFLQRMASDRLDREQLRAFAAQHYLYSRRFARNLAAVISNSPDEHARTLLVLNMYEEIGEPSRLRDRVHLLLLEEGLVSGAQLGQALEEQVCNGAHGDVVSLMIDKGLVSRTQLTQVMEHNTHKARDLTHPALFRRFLRALGLGENELSTLEPLPSTEDFNQTYRRLCRDAHWLEGLAAMGPGTEGIVPRLYAQILEGIRNSGQVTPADYVFWTIHVHCDEGHARNIQEAMRPYATDPSLQRLIWRGTMRALDARARWFDGLLGHVFADTHVRHTSGTHQLGHVRFDSVAPRGDEEAVGT
ncbi:MAG TPA: iron-containing redox enzyme family protein [Polyangiales bacterium]|nr:iron-containing redox enzyme family protein [Polyangiales bacterium]